MFRGADVGPGRANGAFISAFKGSESFDIAKAPYCEAKLSQMSLEMKQLVFVSWSAYEDDQGASDYFRLFCPTIPTCLGLRDERRSLKEPASFISIAFTFGFLFLTFIAMHILVHHFHHGFKSRPSNSSVSKYTSSV